MPDATEARPIDVLHLGQERVICCWQVGDVLIDPGPESSVETVIAALGGEEPRALLLTHIHLDHAGATGALVRRWPGLEVHVHERGARHLVDPSKLLASATRLYGEENMTRLWGEVVPVPEENVTVLPDEGEALGFQVRATPGHASHHSCFFHAESGRAYVGDMAGVRIEPHDFTIAPTPPPDIDLEAWNASLSAIARWEPDSLGITHFGLIENPFAQLAEMRDRLMAMGTLARALSRDEFIEHLKAETVEAVGEEAARTFVQAAPPDQLWSGLERYWSKRDEGT